MSTFPGVVKGLIRRATRKTEQIWLRRWYVDERMQGQKLDLKLDFSSPGKARALADFSFKARVRNTTTCCVLGDVDVQSVTWQGRQIKYRINSPFLILTFPRVLTPGMDVSVQIKYAYVPDQYGSIVQPLTKVEFPVRIWATCRRPLLAVVQGKLVQGQENPPIITYQWQPPRGRRLNAVVADVRSFRKDTPDGMAIWLHVHREWAIYAPRILDVLLDLYRESVDAHHRKLPYQDFHVVEADDPHQPSFNSGGLIVVPKGTFNTDSRPAVYGILAPELNKEWRKDPTRMVASGQSD